MLQKGNQIYIDNDWKWVIPYVYNGTRWVLAKPYEYSNNTWKEVGGAGVNMVVFLEKTGLEYNSTEQFLVREYLCTKVKDSNDLYLKDSDGLYLIMED